jgi:hypothetical protein
MGAVTVVLQRLLTHPRVLLLWLLLRRRRLLLLLLGWGWQRLVKSLLVCVTLLLLIIGSRHLGMSSRRSARLGRLVCLVMLGWLLLLLRGMLVTESLLLLLLLLLLRRSRRAIVPRLQLIRVALVGARYRRNGCLTDVTERRLLT